jgi:XTP/dITP diphosphohydrolase
VDPQPEGIQVEETGITFRDNALLKARAIAKTTGHWALADDSGLSVDALGGAPGVYSARYADSDPERIQRLLRELGDRNDRQARFSAALCIAAPDGSVLAAVEGHCEGSITFSPRGTEGFGYDPVFEVKDSGLTFAEMTLDHKKEHGHRGRAFALLKPELEKLLANNPIQDLGTTPNR